MTLACLISAACLATPANKAALDRHYGKYLSKELNRCTTCHLPSDNKDPQSLDEFPHNPFGNRLKLLGKELAQKNQKKDFATRLEKIAGEDSDGDGVPNEIEILLGFNPGDPHSAPSKEEVAKAKSKISEFKKFLASYRWQPFESVQRPPVPSVAAAHWVKNPIDAFIASEQQKHQLKPRPEASKEVLLRRVYLDLIGLPPTPAEQEAFARDTSSKAYESVVDRLLKDPRYGERWGRHWMDVWRYSDWAGWSGGNQIRDSKPHIWRWRDWIIESLNDNKGYDRMILEMLAADELVPEDTNALRATGFLVRNYKMLSREQWMDDTVKHTSQAFLGITMGCAKCHDHMYDPITQKEYYEMRAIFEPHQVRTDRVPGELDTAKNGLVRTYDTSSNTPTYLFIRGDERRPDTNRVMVPGVPRSIAPHLGSIAAQQVSLPTFAAHPDKRKFVIDESIATAQKETGSAKRNREKISDERALSHPTAEGDSKLRELELKSDLAEAKQTALFAVLQTEYIEDAGNRNSQEWTNAARKTVTAQRREKLADAALKLEQAKSAQQTAESKLHQATNELAAVEKAKSPDDKDKSSKKDPSKAKKDAADKAQKDLEAAKKKTDEAEKALAKAKEESAAAVTTKYTPRPVENFPDTSSGRRLAFARWLIDPQNALTARVAVNQMWLRHFGRGLVPSVADFGRNGVAPTHPQLLDWLAAEFMASKWDMKALHRMILTSSTYRMASTTDAADAKIDPDNTYLWRMSSRRMEAELVRDNVLFSGGDLDPAMGGPDIDNNLGLKSKRRSIYLRQAAEKEVEFLKIFDGPSVTECYQRHPSVVPQQALALANSELAIAEARHLAQTLGEKSGNSQEQFIASAYSQILARKPKPEEINLCREFLAKNSTASATPESIARARQNLLLVLFNHNDFVTIR